MMWGTQHNNLLPLLPQSQPSLQSLINEHNGLSLHYKASQAFTSTPIAMAFIYYAHGVELEPVQRLYSKSTKNDYIKNYF